MSLNGVRVQLWQNKIPEMLQKLKQLTTHKTVTWCMKGPRL